MRIAVLLIFLLFSNTAIAEKNGLIVEEMPFNSINSIVITSNSVIIYKKIEPIDPPIVSTIPSWQNYLNNTMNTLSEIDYFDLNTYWNFITITIPNTTSYIWNDVILCSSC